MKTTDTCPRCGGHTSPIPQMAHRDAGVYPGRACDACEWASTNETEADVPTPTQVAATHVTESRPCRCYRCTGRTPRSPR